MRKSLVLGNWKMTGTAQSSTQLVSEIIKGLAVKENAEIGVCVPFVYFDLVKNLLEGTVISLGSQNVADQESGAYTGEISAGMLKDFNCKYALVGHSERRSYYGDTSQSVAIRFKQAIAEKVIPVLCIGETLEEREENKTFDVINSQLNPVFDLVGIDSFAGAVIAYEPVWAIGTGKTATSEQAQEVHRYIRDTISTKNATVADGLQILYGGSVNAKNATELFAMPDIDGGLIGGASLNAESFLQVYQSA